MRTTSTVLFSATLAAMSACSDAPPDSAEPVEAARAALTTPWSSSDLGGVSLQFDPSVVGSDSVKRAFYVGPNGHLWLSQFDGGPWWSAPADLGGVQLTSSPSAIVSGANAYRVFYRGPNGHLWMSSYDGGPWWSAPADLGGVNLTSAPAAVVVGAGKWRVFYRGPNGRLWMSAWDGGPWWSQAWDLGGVVITGAPAAVVPQAEPNNIRVFYRGANDHLWMSSDDGGPWWSAPADLGGTTLTTSPSAVSSQPHRMDVFYGGPGAQLMHSEWDGGPWWSGVYQHGVALGSAPSARTAWQVYYRNPDSGHLTLALPGAVNADVADPGRTQWLVGTAFQSLYNWCLPDLQVSFHGDPAHPAELMLFARDPDAVATRLASLSDGDIRNGAWTSEVSAPDGTPRVMDLPFPAHIAGSWDPTVQSLSTARFWGSPSVPANGDTLCFRPQAPGQPAYLGAVKAAATLQKARCATAVDLENDVLPAIANGTYQGLHDATGTYNVNTIYSHIASILRRDASDPTTLNGGIEFAFHYSFDLGGVGNEVWASWEWLFALADGELSVTRAHENRMDYSGWWGPTVKDQMETKLYHLDEKVREFARGKQEIADAHYSFLTCNVPEDCAPTADLVAVGMTPENLARVGFPGATADDLLHMRCAVGQQAACNALGVAANLPAHWSCRDDHQCRFRLPAKRLNPAPDFLEMVWFDGVERDNPAFAFAAAGGAAQMCSLQPTLLAPLVQHFLRYFVRNDLGQG